MLKKIGGMIHNFLLRQRTNNHPYIGKIYAMGIMFFIVLLRVSFKIGSGAITSEFHGDGILEHAGRAHVQLLHALLQMQSQQQGNALNRNSKLFRKLTMSFGITGNLAGLSQVR